MSADGAWPPRRIPQTIGIDDKTPVVPCDPRAVWQAARMSNQLARARARAQREAASVARLLSDTEGK